MNAKCTLLVNSYDGGEDCWKPFFQSIAMQWSEMDLPIVLNTESKSFSFPPYQIKTFSLYKRGEKVPWGERLIQTLKRIETDYILFFLEDYWLNAPVNDAVFRKTLTWLDENPDVATFVFSSKSFAPQQDNGGNKFEGFVQDRQKCEYKIQAQIAVWRRTRLIEFIRPHESPWEWEVLGSVRASRYTDKFYVWRQELPEPFPYHYSVDGESYPGIVVEGKWIREMVEYYSTIYDLSGIDFSIRGFADLERRRRLNQMTALQRILGHEYSAREIAGKIWERALIRPYRRWLSLRL